MGVCMRATRAIDGCPTQSTGGDGYLLFELFLTWFFQILTSILTGRSWPGQEGDHHLRPRPSVAGLPQDPAAVLPPPLRYHLDQKTNA